MFTHKNSDFGAIVARENTRFSSLLAAGDVSREMSLAAGEEQREAAVFQASAISVMECTCAAPISKAMESHTG